MKIDISQFRDKASTRPEELAIYERAEGYIEAYSKHTDYRVKNHGPHRAIGGQWEEHGPMQLEFLQSMGLTPESKLLDFGCGTGRFARHAVPFLNSGNYMGVDISGAAIAHAVHLSEDEGWAEKNPAFLRGDGTLSGLRGPFDLVWAHSVFTHLPEELIQKVIEGFARLEAPQFLFTYKLSDTPMRTGLKQFSYPPEFFMGLAKKYNLRAETLDNRWPAKQRTMRVWK